MTDKIPGIVVTGASGFVGRHFVAGVNRNFRLFCLARRSQKEVGLPLHHHIHWLQVDITKWSNLLSAERYIQDHGGADYVLHLAGYYDFTMKENQAYELTNVTGTRYLLEISQLLVLKRFIFASSLAACEFPSDGKLITEDSLPDANYPYARSKCKGEALVKEYSSAFPCSIVRLAAVFSDWCEYPMLYMLLKYWLSKNKLISRIVAGKGESAIPYIHINDLVKLFLRIIDISDQLPRFAVYNASPQECVSHNELYRTAVKYYHGCDIKPFRLPMPAAASCLLIKSVISRIGTEESLEQPWMRKYIDKKLQVDATATYRALAWKPTPRYNILRRLLFLTEKKISRPYDWAFRNEILIKRVAYRKSGTIYTILNELQETLIAQIIEAITSPKNTYRFPNYRKMDPELLRWCVAMHYHMIIASVRNRDRTMIPGFMKEIARRRYMEGFKVDEVREMIFLTAKIMKGSLLGRQELRDAKQRVDDYIVLTSQFAADEVADNFDMLTTQPSPEATAIPETEPLITVENIRQIIAGLKELGEGRPTTRLGKEVLFKNYGVMIKLESSP